MANNQNQLQAGMHAILNAAEAGQAGEQPHQQLGNNNQIHEADRTIFLTFSRWEQYRGPVTQHMLEEGFTELFGDNIVHHVSLPHVEYPTFGFLVLTNANLVHEVLGGHPPRRLQIGPDNYSVWLKPFQQEVD